MTDFDPTIGEQLDRLVPPTSTSPNWEDVLTRWRAPVWRRPLVLAVVAALVVLGTGAAVTAALGGFDRWLAGKPGKPAAPADQQRFAAANGHSWASFPTDTKLRQLISATVGRKRYVLFGFRSGNELCLRLRAVSLGHTTGFSCVSASTLAHLAAPILVVDGNDGLQDRFGHPSSEFSYGIVADGVTRVDVRAIDGMHRARLGGNAYLWVENEPNTGNRVTGITAIGPGNRRTSLPVREFGIPNLSPPRNAPGPSRIQAKIPHPTIGWYVHRQPRGLAPDQARLTPAQLRGLDKGGFTRLVKPDPLSDIVVGLTDHLCLLVVGGGESCSPEREFFSRSPLNVTEFERGSSLTSVAIAGAAADGVARVVIFSSDGERQQAALRDNLFTAIAPGQAPLRIVGYDSVGRVVGFETFQGFTTTTAPAATLNHLRTVLTVRGPHGAVGTIRVGRTVNAFRCWRAEFSTGQTQSGCEYVAPTGPWTYVENVQPAGRDVFILGHVRAPVVLVRLRFANGNTVAARPVAGLFLFAVPRSHLSRTRQLAFVIGYDRYGNPVQRQGVLFRANE